MRTVDVEKLLGLDQSVAVVTGGAGGIGRATASALRAAREPTMNRRGARYPDHESWKQKCVLTLNAGSSSLKFALFDIAGGAQPLMRGLVEKIGSVAAHCSFQDAAGTRIEGPPPPRERVHSHERLLGWLLPALQELSKSEIVAAGHRIVHGGMEFSGAVPLDDDALRALEKLIPLARTHQPHNLAAVRSVQAMWPDLLQVGSFDTAFHATIPDVGRHYALPESITSKGVRRYGFHGLSYKWIASQLPAYLGALSDGRIIVAHLGNGSSLCGMVGRKSRATSMGFTPIDGLVMGERPGAVDPGVILFLFEELAMSAAQVHDLLFRESGLKGVSGISNDMRSLLESQAPSAKFAVDLYVHRAVREIGAIAAEIGGVDAFVFTAGIGENAPEIRARIVEGCRWLGMDLDSSRNAANQPRISAEGAQVAAYVIPTNEEAVIADGTRKVMRGETADRARQG